MTPNIYEFKMSDTAPTVTAYLRDHYGQPIIPPDIVQFVMAASGGVSPKTQRQATILDTETMLVEYRLNSNDMDTPGEFWQEWRCLYPDGSVLTVPNDSYDIIRVIPALTSAYPLD